MTTRSTTTMMKSSLAPSLLLHLMMMMMLSSMFVKSSSAASVVSTILPLNSMTVTRGELLGNQPQDVLNVNKGVYVCMCRLFLLFAVPPMLVGCFRVYVQEPNVTFLLLRVANISQPLSCSYINRYGCHVG